MEFRDFDIDDNEFDDFFRRRRPRRRRREMPLETKEVKISDIEINKGLDSERKKKRAKHKKVLGQLKTQGFFSNPNNHKKVYNQVKKMAVEIDGLSKKLIEEKAKKKCVCQRRRKYKNFEGEEGINKFWHTYRTPLLLGGAIYFFFFSKMGKRMIKK